MSAVDVQAAYRHCERVTRARARNFYYGIRLLPPAKRSALCAVYTFARRVDDIGDGRLGSQEKLDRLAAARSELGQLGPGGPWGSQARPGRQGAEQRRASAPRADPDPALVALADASARFLLPLQAFGELIEGVEMDVRGTSYPTFEELAHYCRCVAGSVGRLSLGVFGSSDPETATVLADRLGIAMQLTNILRDLREDAEAGRVYLPKEELVRFGCDGDLVPASAPPASSARFVRLVDFQVVRAQRFFAEGLRLLPLLDRRSAACVSAMSGIYRHLLGHIARHPEAVLNGRVSLPAWQKAEIAVRSLIGMSP
ncbi:MAG TPA: squalene/phytoene synthase family protein [Actinomycetota bacterium]|jgi:phytoene synthase|nr:squalene/phytoene synthase family protein [Actinomycetota bacterium]